MIPLIFFGTFYIANTIEGLTLQTKLTISIIAVLVALLFKFLMMLAIAPLLLMERFENIPGAIGKNVKIIKELGSGDASLNLSEIELYDILGTKLVGLKATSSSVIGPFSPDFLVDDSTENFALTGDSNNEWFNVELPTTMNIGKVVLHNRKDCCQDKIQGAQIVILNELGNEVYRSDKISSTDLIQTFEVTSNVFTDVKPVVVSQEILRAQAEEEQAKLDAESRKVGGKSTKPQTLFSAPIILENQINEQELLDRIRSTDLSDPNDKDEYTIIDPEHWSELNPKKALCNYKCELQPVVMEGTSKYLTIKHSKPNSLAEQIIKAGN